MDGESRSLLTGTRLTAGYGDGPDVFSGVSVCVARGSVLCIVGPNGCGKSTLLATLAGVLRPRSGQVTIEGKPLEGLPDTRRAQLVGYLPQSVQPFTSYIVRELVALGRFPHATGLGFETEEDEVAIQEAMELTRTLHLSHRLFHEISGGERQRVLIASVLASKPEVFLLDEPTGALDIGQRSVVFGTLRELADAGSGVAVVTHDLNLAAIFSDEMILFGEGGLVAFGSPKDVITQGNLESAYGDGDGFVMVPRFDGEVPAVLPARFGGKK
jgi:iron complex transport system ATP-binding protein